MKKLKKTHGKYIILLASPLYLSATNLFLGPLFLGRAWVTRILLPAILAPSASVQASWG